MTDPLDCAARLTVHDRRLRLLSLHLLGPALLDIVEVDDIVQETYLRAITSGLPAEGEMGLVGRRSCRAMDNQGCYSRDCGERLVALPIVGSTPT